MRQGLLAGDVIETRLGGHVTTVAILVQRRWGYAKPIETTYVLVETASDGRRAFAPADLMTARDETAVCSCGAVFERPRGTYRFVGCGSCRDAGAPKETLRRMAA